MHRIVDPDPLGSCQFLISDWLVIIGFQEFATCKNPPSRRNYRKAPFPRTQQRDSSSIWSIRCGYGCGAVWRHMSRLGFIGVI